LEGICNQDSLPEYLCLSSKDKVYQIISYIHWNNIELRYYSFDQRDGIDGLLRSIGLNSSLTALEERHLFDELRRLEQHEKASVRLTEEAQLTIEALYFSSTFM